MVGRTASTALRTDHYELTMIDAALGSGIAHHRAVFEAFARELPAGRRYGVVAGTGRLLDAIEAFRFEPDQLGWLVGQEIISAACAEHLAGWRFAGDIDGYREGDLYFASSPIFTVEADFASAVVLETLILSILNHDSAIASAAARFRTAAGDQTLIEGGSRRTDEGAAVGAARAAWIAGFDVTSNLEAGFRYGIPTGGTAAHALTLAHPSELDAFRAQVARFGPGTTFLVDTFDIAQGVGNALAAADGHPGQVRVDSGDLADGARLARRLLDQAGATDTRICVSGDLDEAAIAQLEADGAPIDAYLVGTKLVTGSGHPTCGMVYKLVAVADGPGADAPMRPVAKRSNGKTNVGGRKVGWRQLGPDGTARQEITVVQGRARHLYQAPDDRADPPNARALPVPLFRAGERVNHDTAADARDTHRSARAELTPTALDLSPGPPALAVTVTADRP
jgi:nicotinate phosphoribosyltransferase